jgi:hypothetical protein
VWNQRFEFDIYHPELSIIRFAVYDKNIVQEDSFLCESIIPISKLRTGIRCVSLLNASSKLIDGCHLLTEIRLTGESIVKSYQLISEDSRSLQQENLRLKLHIDRIQHVAQLSNTNNDILDVMYKLFRQQAITQERIEKQISEMITILQSNSLMEKTKQTISEKLTSLRLQLEHNNNEKSMEEIDLLIKFLTADISSKQLPKLPTSNKDKKTLFKK